MRTVQVSQPPGPNFQPVKSLPKDAVTATAERVGSPSAVIAGSSWTHFLLWLFAWNAAVPIRLLGGIPYPNGISRTAISLTIEQTSWALVTYVMFRFALRARREPMRQVVAGLVLLAIPLIVIRYYGTSALTASIGLGRPPVRFILMNGPLYLFLMAAGAALGFLVVYIHRERDNAVLQANLKAELAAARLQTLRLQLNPHFLFNALNAIASLVPSDAAKADTAIGALSSFLRASLSSNREEETTLEDELKLVDAYLEIESLRFEWLTVDLDVPDTLRSACVPVFVLQLLVENAIRHGLAPRRAPGRVVIAARLNRDRLTLSVTDDGVGVSAKSDASLGIGLDNVRARLAQLHGSEGRLTIEPAKPTGTVATIHLPYRACASAQGQASASS